MKKTFTIFLQLVKQGLRLFMPHSVIRSVTSVTSRFSKWSSLPTQVVANSSQSLFETYPDLNCLSQKDFLRQKEEQVYSQNGEDGITLHLLSKISTTRRFVEIGIEDGRECNSAVLSLLFGWQGLLVEGDPAMAEKARRFYQEKTEGRVEVATSFVAPTTINDLLKKYGFVDEIDLLSIDIDSFDYWLWKEIEVVQPRVLIMEYNANFGPRRSVTVPCEEGFNRFKKHFSGYYWGASLTALTKLSQDKGYDLVGCNAGGINAFFVRTDLTAKTGLTQVTPEQAYYPLKSKLSRDPGERVMERIKSLELINV